MQPSVNLAPEVMVGGRYRLIAPLDSGSTASVWRALDVQLEREVALKILREHGVDPALRERAEREARVLAGLSHPNIVRVLDCGEDDGRPFMVMELLDGESLSRVSARAERLPVPDAVLLVADVADGLGAAHARGVIHRDVKPANIVCHGSVPTLVDFGIARNIDATTLTQGLVVGTAAYLAPEQAQGRPLQPTADVYALGCVLYELLTGRPPFSGDSSVAVAMQHVHDEPVPPSELADVPPAVDAIVLRCLAKDPDRRPADGLALAGALRHALAAGEATETVAIAPVPIDGTAVMPAIAAAEVIDPSPLPEPDQMPSRTSAPASAAMRPAFRPDWRLVAAAVVLVVLGIAFFAGGSGIDVKTRAVPDVTNSPVADATKYLEGAGLDVDIDNVASDRPAGTVIATDPAAGEQIDEGGTVRMQVSSGSATSTTSAAPTTTVKPTVEVQVGGKPRGGKKDG